jgi:hypothetical protein
MRKPQQPFKLKAHAVSPSRFAMKALFVSLLVSLASTPALAVVNENVLRSECAAKNPVKVTKAAVSEYQFVYYKGVLRGEVRKGKTLPCAEAQYEAYVASLDPARVMALNPTAAGGKPVVEEFSFSYKKGKLVSKP